jgi:hypothetical protein
MACFFGSCNRRAAGTKEPGSVRRREAEIALWQAA